MRYCKVKATGKIIETQSGDDNLEVMYTNNASYARDELDVGVADEAVVYGWLADQRTAEMTYADKRKSEYPITGDQLDMLWHAIDDGTLDKTSTFYTSLKATKDKYPKT